jgi:hypothetical protein
VTDPIGSVGRPPGSRRVRARRSEDAERVGARSPGECEAVGETAAAGPVPPSTFEGAPAVSAQVLSQTGSAEGAANPANVARQASSAYLSVEWSGGADRRTSRGRIAKTKV